METRLWIVLYWGRRLDNTPAPLSAHFSKEAAQQAALGAVGGGGYVTIAETVPQHVALPPADQQWAAHPRWLDQLGLTPHETD